MTEGTTPAQRAPGFRAFLFSDLRGYTAFIEAQGDEAGARLLERYRGLVRQVIATHDGAEIRTEGDSFYVTFRSASMAVIAGLAIVARATQSADDDAWIPIRVGVGIHAGETAETAEGPVGSAINVAARICAAARPGEVLVSDTVRGLVRTNSAISFVARGRPVLKGVTEPIELFAAIDPAAGPISARNARRGRRLSRSSARLAAVLGSLGVLAAVGILAGMAVSNGQSGRPARSLAGVPSTAPAASPDSAVLSATLPSTGPDDFPTNVEGELLALLPPALAVLCTRAEAGDGSLGGETSLRCEPLGERRRHCVVRSARGEGDGDRTVRSPRCRIRLSGRDVRPEEGQRQRRMALWIGVRRPDAVLPGRRQIVDRLDVPG